MDLDLDPLKYVMVEVVLSLGLDSKYFMVEIRGISWYFMVGSFEDTIPCRLVS